VRALFSASRRQKQNAASEHWNKAQRSHDESLVSSIREPCHSGDGTESDKSEWDVEQDRFELVKAKVLDDQATKPAETAGRDAVDMSV
jgi:hypothetical protein